MKQFKVIAMYDYPEIDRSVLIKAVDARQALLRAVMDLRLPICYRRDNQGNQQPVFWNRSLGVTSRWPRIEKENYLVWQEWAEMPARLRFEVIEVE